MKTASLRDVKQQLSNYVDSAQKESILITRHGKPAALVYGVAGYDLEDIFYMTDPGFWKMLQKRRKEKTVSLEKVK